MPTRTISQYYINEESIAEEVRKRVAINKKKNKSSTIKNNPNLEIISVNLPIIDLVWIDRFKKLGITASRSEFVRNCVRDRVIREDAAIKYQMAALKDINYEVLE
ncbi:hypothetical protein LCGC14_2964220 [marine sediment metagenome]|uniref:Ribbon-helix-helix protein CopG domain-containing protein n=1 Tax=marine sediment metagenome TaxID=412755 RepID=A0A0F8XC78_9ZZZZ